MGLETAASFGGPRKLLSDRQRWLPRRRYPTKYAPMGLSTISRPTSAGRRGQACPVLSPVLEAHADPFVDGTWGTYGGGLVLTPHGEQIARQLMDADRDHSTNL